MATSSRRDAFPPPSSPGRHPGISVQADEWLRLLDLIDQACDIPTSARPEWIARLDLPAHLDLALRHLLENRLAIEQEGFLSDLPALSGSRPRTPGRLAPGEMVGAWRLLHQIGEGGMSTVWLAERADGQIARRAALKLPHAGPGQELLAKRMLRERDILAGLEHRHIARLYDVGVTDAGVPYLVMEYVEGATLTDHADEQRWTVVQRLAIFRQALAAVQFAHGKLILHRDLKPANILVDAHGEVKLLDFGIAKLMSPSDGVGGATEMTRIAGRRLTPAYASPEQLRGDILGTSSDVYSLGVVLYELLCGRRPFDIEGLSIARIEQAIMERDPRPMARQDLDAGIAETRGTTLPVLCRILAGDLSAIVSKAIATSPVRRYASVDALDADLARWMAGKPVLAHAPGKLYLFGKFLDRYRWPVGLGAAAITALIATSSVALVQGHMAQREAARAASVRDFLLAMFGDTDPNRPASQELTARRLLDNGRQRAMARLGTSPAEMGELLTYIGNAQVNISDNIGAERSYVAALDAYRRGGDERGRLLVLLARIDNLLALGRVAEAHELVIEAERSAQPWLEDPSVMGTLLREHGYVEGFRYEFASERDLLRRYLRLADTHPGMPSLERVQVLQNLATASSHLDDLPAALAYIDEAFRVLGSHGDLPAAARFDVSVYQQDILFGWGRYADVEATSPRQSRDCDRELSPLSQACLKLKTRLLISRLRLGLIDEALSQEAELAPLLNPASPRDQLIAVAAIDRALARAGRLSTRPDQLTLLVQLAHAAEAHELDANYQLVALNALAEIHLLSRRPEEAMETIAKAEHLVVGRKGVNAGEIRRLQALKGVALQQEGQAAASLEVMKSLCDSEPPSSGIGSVQEHFLRLNCVPPLLSAGHTDAAVVLLQQSLHALRPSLGEASPTLHLVEQWLADLQSGHTPPPAAGGIETVFS